MDWLAGRNGLGARRVLDVEDTLRWAFIFEGLRRGPHQAGDRALERARRERHKPWPKAIPPAAPPAPDKGRSQA